MQFNCLFLVLCETVGGATCWRTSRLLIHALGSSQMDRVREGHMQQ